MVEQTPVVHSAETVGKAFASQYYAILQHSPELVHRFYLDTSLLGRPQGELMDCSTTMKAINEKILSYGNFKADIKYVDAQDSHDGGVIVLVVGAVVNEDESRRNFSQTFFLAPQEKGYYVLNDIFRFVKDDDPEIDVEQVDGIISAELNEVNHISELSNGEICHPKEEVHNPVEEVHSPSEEVNTWSVEERNLNGQLPVIEVKKEVQSVEEEPIPKVVDEVPQQSRAMVESSAEVYPPKKSHVVESRAKADTSKKSYASIVMKDVPTPMSPPVHPISVSKMQDRQVAIAPVAVPPSFDDNSVDDRVDGNNQVSEGKGYSVYLRNLPMNVTYYRVQEEFQEFGPIKSDGIQIRHTVGFSYGFVEFETAAAAQSAIEASPIHIDKNVVAVEEKRSTAGRGGSFGVDNRERYYGGRGRGNFRGDGVRGRGGYGGGRGYRREESNRGDFGGGGRGFQNRNEGYQKSDHNGNGSVRMNRGGGSGYVSTRTQEELSQA